MKRFLTIAAIAAGILFFLPDLTLAQTQTAVTGTVTGTDGVVWNGGQISAVINTPGGSSLQLTPCTNPGPAGCPVTPSIPATGLGAAGAYSMNLWADASILPAGTTYTFTATINGMPPPIGTGPQTCTVSGVTISGASQTVNLTGCPALTNINGGGGGGTVNPGTQYKIPAYANSGSGTVVGPSNISTDSGKNNLNVPGAATITGNAVIGGPDPWIDFTAPPYSASGSAQSTTATCVSGVASLTLAAAIDFKNGQGLMVPGCGANPTVTVPTGITVIPQGTGGSTTYNYSVACVDAGGGNSGYTSLGASTTTGNAALNGTNYNAIYFTLESGCPGFVLVGRATGSPTVLQYMPWEESKTTFTGATATRNGSNLVTMNVGGSQGLPFFPGWFVTISACVDSSYDGTVQVVGLSGSGGGTFGYSSVGSAGSTTGCTLTVDPTFFDFGTTFPLPSNLTVGVSPTPDIFTAKISSGAGTTIVATSAAPSQNASGKTVWHDDTAALTAAIAASAALSNTVQNFCPAGTYLLSSALSIAANFTLHGPGSPWESTSCSLDQINPGADIFRAGGDGIEIDNLLLTGGRIDFDSVGGVQHPILSQLMVQSYEGFRASANMIQFVSSNVLCQTQDFCLDQSPAVTTQGATLNGWWFSGVGFGTWHDVRLYSNSNYTNGIEINNSLWEGPLGSWMVPSNTTLGARMSFGGQATVIIRNGQMADSGTTAVPWLQTVGAPNGGINALMMLGGFYGGESGGPLLNFPGTGASPPIGTLQLSGTFSGGSIWAGTAPQLVISNGASTTPALPATNLISFGPSGALSVFGIATLGSIIDGALTPGTTPICPNGTGGAFTTAGCTGTGTGTVQTGAIHTPTVYTGSGSSTTVGPTPSCTPPTVNGIYDVLFSVTGGVAVDESCPQVGLGGRALTGAASTDIVLYSDNNTVIDHDVAGSASIAETLPTATTLGNAAMGFSYANHSSHTDTITPTTWTIQEGTAAAAPNISVKPGTTCRIKVDPNSTTNWLADCFADPSLAANQALSNLSSPALNAAPSPGTDNAISVDDLTHRFVNLWLAGVAGWTNGSGTADTGFSRDAAGVVDLGNGTVGNKSGTLNLATLNATAAINVGATPPTACGSATGCLAFGEASGAGTPTAAMDYMRGNSTTHSFECSINNSAESPCNPSIPTSATSGHIVTWATWPAQADGGTFASNIPSQYKAGQRVCIAGGTGTSNALQSGDDTICRNGIYNDSGVTWTLTAIKCFTDVGSSTTTINPTFGSDGTGTTILSGALTCGSSYVPSSTGTISSASLATGNGIAVGMGGTLTGHQLTMIVEYTY